MYFSRNRSYYNIFTKKSLKVGEALPTSVWTTPMEVVNHPQKTIKLSEDKDKLILLDFWNTWCSACLTNFPKMEELQKKFSGKIKILAVSNQDRSILEKFFASKMDSVIKVYYRLQEISYSIICFHTLLYHILFGSKMEKSLIQQIPDRFQRLHFWKL